MGLIRNHYVGRTFIEPQQSIRHFGTKVQIKSGQTVLRGKRVVVVDDSIVRGQRARRSSPCSRTQGLKSPCTDQLSPHH